MSWSNQIKYIGLLVLLALLYGQIEYWQAGPVGWLLFIFFICLAGSLWADIFFRTSADKSDRYSVKIIGILTYFFLLGLIAGCFATLNRLSGFNIFLSCVLTTALTILAHFIAGRCRKKKYPQAGKFKPTRFALFSGRTIYLFIYLVLYLLCWYLLFNKTGEVVPQFSPWQSLSKYYLLIFFVLTVVLSVLLLSKIKTRILLTILVFHSLLLHAYVPLSNANPAGGDVWRHIANERILISENYIYPVLIGDRLDVKDFGSLSLPQVIFQPQKFSYSHLWGTNVVLNRITNANLLNLHKYLVPILWSVGVTILMYFLGSLIFNSKQRGLWLAGFSLVPFSLQAMGAITMPVSLDLILFVLIVWWWLVFLRNKQKKALLPILIFAPFLLFSYWLYLLLFVLLIMMSFVGWLIRKIQKKLLKSLAVGAFGLVCLVILPVIELIFGYAKMPDHINIIANVKQMLGQLSGWYYASLIRGHDILSGNLLFNHTPDYAYVSSIFTNFRWQVVCVMFFVWLLAFVGIVRTWRKAGVIRLVLFWFLCLILGAYSIGWFILEGDRLLTRRLDGIFVIMILVFALLGLNWIILRQKIYFRIQLPKFIIKSTGSLFLLILSWFAATAYASGPDIRTLTKTEYEVGNYIARLVETDVSICVLADTWPLLAVEAETVGGVIGGNFPIDYQFGQPERVKLLDLAINNPNSDVWTEAAEITEATMCLFAVNTAIYGENQVNSLKSYYGEPLENIESFMVWKIDLPGQ